MAFKSRLSGIAMVVLVVVLMFPLTRLACELLEFRVRSYATYAEASASGGMERGRLPDLVPASAARIREIHAVDSNAQWLVFDVPPAVTGEITAGMTPIAIEEARKSGVNRPWRAGQDWPPELSRLPVSPPRDSERLAFFRSPDGAYCLAVDRQAGRVFAWRCHGAA